MKTETLKLSGSCRLEVTRYEGIDHYDVCLEYVEHATDHWNSDSTTTIDISGEDANKIIAFLRAAYPDAPAPTPKEPTP